MAVLNHRRVKLTVARPLAADYNTMSAQVTIVEDLRVQFKVTKTLGKEPNRAEISVTNAAPVTRAEFQVKGARVALQAGYRDGVTLIFMGDVTVADNTREGSDWVTKVQAGDGERAYLYARVSESFRAGVRVPDVVRVVAKKLGVDVGDLDKQLGGRPGQFVGGYVAHGRASAEMSRALAAIGLSWSIQDGRLQVLAEGQANAEAVVHLNPDTGLVGSPESGTAEAAGGGKSAVIKARSLLQGGLKPGGRVVLSAEHFSEAMLKVQRVTHTGDTAGGEFYTDAELTP